MIEAGRESRYWALSEKPVTTLARVLAQSNEAPAFWRTWLLLHVQELIRCEQYLAKIGQGLLEFGETGRNLISVGLKVVNLIGKEGH